MIKIIILIFTVFSFSNADDTPKKIRQPKIFYVSTSDAETTISANTACWTSSTNAATTCGKRKRRALILDAANPQSEKIAPTREAIKKVDEEFEESLDRNLDSGLVEEGENREPKFVYYWMTTTRTFTSTSFTKTFTIYSVSCTPNGFGYDLCG